MLCSNCLKRIPEGEEVQRAVSNIWRTSWGGYGGGSEIVCRSCAIKIRKRERRYWKILVFFIIGHIATVIIALVFVMAKGG